MHSHRHNNTHGHAKTHEDKLTDRHIDTPHTLTLAHTYIQLHINKNDSNNNNNNNNINNINNNDNNDYINGDGELWSIE